MKNSTNKFTVLLLFLFITWSCNDDATDGLQTFDDVLKQGVNIEDIPQEKTTEILEEGDPYNDDVETEDDNADPVTERWVCTRKTVRVTDGNGQFPLFNTNADVIYPGNLLQGKTLSDATPAPIVVKRSGGAISYDLNNGNLNSTFTVDEVKKSTIQNAMNNIIAGAGTVVPANFQLDIERVQSREQLALEMGINVETFTTKVSSDMSFSSDREYNRFLVKLKQSYYTMSFDLPTSLEELFDESVTPDQLSVYVAPDNPATFISSVTYGRIFYMLIESTSSEQEMQAKLDVSYGAFRNKVEGEVDVETFNSLKNVKIKVIAYGGDAEGTFELAGESTISNIAEKLAESTDIRAGLPLSYVVRSVARPDKIVGTKLATEYDVVDCELRGVLPPIGFASWVDLFDDGIGAMVNIAQSNVILYNKAGDQYAWYNGNSGKILGKFAIDDPDGPLGASSLGSIGSVVRFAGSNCFNDANSNDRLYVFNSDGLEYEIFRYDESLVSGNDLPAGPVGTIDKDGENNRIYLVNETFGDSGNFQFANDGFEAVTRIGFEKMAFFAKPGDRYAIYNRSSGGTWEDPVDTDKWFNSRCGQDILIFDRIGATTTISFGGSSCRYLFVNEAGNELMVWFADCENQGPWIIK
jgi:thiol-activated cytolysin